MMPLNTEPFSVRPLHTRLLNARLRLSAHLVRETALADYVRALLPLLSLTVRQAPLMALDLEMTGLDPQRDQLLSIGLVPITAGRIPLAGARHKLVAIDGSVGASAAVHGIVDRNLEQAVTIEQAMAWFLRETRGCILVAHHAPLDLAFLRHNLRLVYGKCPGLVALDTLTLERRRLLRHQQSLQQGSLRLGACRSRYGLPVYGGHDAPSDALACAELLLAQLAAMGDEEELCLAPLLGIYG